MKCLLVDDEPGLRDGLAAWLRRQGLEVRTAPDCAGARAALAAGEAFDVVVTDWRLPDGLASSFLAGVGVPVLAVSGHPEEVVRVPAMRAVLGKPTAPRALLAAIHAAAGDPPAAPAGPAPADLPVDVHDAIAAFVALLPAGAVPEIADDGTFVAVEATVPPGTPLPVVPHGDLQRHAHGEAVQWRLRLRRDGRADGDLAVVAPDGRWPAAGTFAIDFHGSRTSPSELLACLDRVAAVLAAGRRVQLLNLPAPLRSVAAGHGTAHVMPMRDAVGPRLPAELTDLWSLP